MNSGLRRIVPLVLLSASSVVALAKGDISGKVLNKQTGEPMDFATVQLLDSKGKPLTIGCTTNEKGIFTLTGVPDGTYILRVTNLGNVPVERAVKIAGTNVKMSDIRMAEDAKLLQEVVVEGVRSQMRFELDKKVFNVDANIASSGASASELLESIPSVEVDQDGEVSLRGNSSVSVWINGKESGLNADNRAQILEQLPAETIEKIEVITNPSAKYDPEGTAGIINIVLKKDRRAGYFGAAELGANTRGGGNASASINYNAGKWDTYASVGFRMRHNKRMTREDRDYDNGTFLHSYGKTPTHGNNIFLRAGATYNLTSKDAFTLNGFGMFGHRWSHGNTLYSSNLPGQWIANDQFSRSRNDMRGAHGELSYRREWSSNHTLDIIAGFNYWGGPSTNEYLETQEWPEGYPTAEDEYSRQEREVNTKSWEAKIDYVNQLTKWLKLEAGFNGNYSHENSPVTSYNGTSDADMTLTENLYNRFIYDNNVSALYFTLGGKVNQFSFSAGLRGEAWQVRAYSLAYGQTKADGDFFKTNKFSLFPSVFLSYTLPKDNELQINYTRRIRRPWGAQLNSFRDIKNPTNIHYGNPALQPQYSNSYELNYIKNWEHHIISFSGYLRTTSDVIEHISYLHDGIMYTTLDNVTRNINAGCEIVAKNNLFRNILNLTTTVNLYNDHVSAWEADFNHNGTIIPLSGKERNNFAWNVSCMAGIRLPWGLSLQLTGRYRSSTLTAQGSNNANWNVDAGLRKSLGNWSFSVNCRDVFNSRRFKSVLHGDDYTLYSERRRGGTTVRFTVKYSFGNMKDQKRGRRDNSMEPMDGSGYGEGME